MADNAQDKAQIIQMGTVSNPVPVSGQVWWDGTHIQMRIGSTTYQLDHPVTSAWSLSGVSASRTYNPATASNSQVAQAIGTLIQDLQTVGLVG